MLPHVTFCLSSSDALVLLWCHDQPIIISTTIGLDADVFLVDIVTEYKSIKKDRRTHVRPTHVKQRGLVLAEDTSSVT